jgi:hypothetical protein
MAPSLDPLESRQLLSTVVLPVHGPIPRHHHRGARMHHTAVVGRVHSPQHARPDPPAAATVSAASTTFNVVAQFSNAEFATTATIADNDIWAVGVSNPDTSNEQPLAVHFDGSSWSAIPTPTVMQPASLGGVAGVASNDVWAVGYQTVPGSKKKDAPKDEPLIEHWDGTSWTVVSSPNLPNGGSLGGVTAISTNDVWAVGNVLDSSGAVVAALVEHWDGTSWNQVSSPAFNGSGVGRVSADASNDVWAVGGGVIHHFDGMSWSRTVLPPALYGGPLLFGVAALSPSNVWAVGMVRPQASFEWMPLVKHWDGTSWSTVSSPDPNRHIGYNLQGIVAISAGDIWADGSVGIENWNGTSWSIVSDAPSGVSGALGAAAALSDGTVVIVSSGGTIIEN